MHIPEIFERQYLRIIDTVFARRRQPLPTIAVLQGCKIISHRGEHDGVEIKENTLAAFDKAFAAGVWGIELDVRWTNDEVPVVAHDPDLNRVFGRPDIIRRLTWSALRRKVPQVPRLADVVNRYGRRMHLMIEIKRDAWPAPPTRSRTLQEALAPLAAVQDYHLMSLTPKSLSLINGFPSSCLVAIANTWPDRHSHWVLDNQWGGVCTHFSLLRKALIRRHKRRGQKVGVGYPASPNSVKRELNRGVDWIFSNNAAEVQAMVARMMTEVERGRSK